MFLKVILIFFFFTLIFHLTTMVKEAVVVWCCSGNKGIKCVVAMVSGDGDVHDIDIKIIPKIES